MGKNHRNMSNFRKAWRQQHPPNADGNYICWLCGLPVEAAKVTLDHVAPVAQYPEYAKDMSNIRPAHGFCNEQRGQPRHSQLIKRFGRAHKRTTPYRHPKRA